MTDVTLDTSTGYGNGLGSGDTRFHLPGMVAGDLVVQILGFVPGTVDVTISDSTGVVLDDPGNNASYYYTGWGSVTDGEAVIEVNGSVGVVYALGWGNSSMDTNEAHWSRTPPLDYDTHAATAFPADRRRWGGGVMQGEMVSPWPHLHSDYSDILLATTHLGPYPDAYNNSGEDGGSFASADTGYTHDLSCYATYPGCTGPFGAWSWVESTWATATLSWVPTRQNMIDQFAGRLPDEPDNYAPNSYIYPRYQRGSPSIEMSPVTVEVTVGNISEYGWTGPVTWWDQLNNVELWNLTSLDYLQDSTSPQDLSGKIPLLKYNPLVAPGAIGNSPGDSLLAIQTGVFTFDWSELPLIFLDQKIPGWLPGGTYDNGGGNGDNVTRVITNQYVSFGLTTASLRTASGMSAYDVGWFTAFYHVSDIQYSVHYSLPGVDMYMGQGPGRGVAKIKTLDGSWRELGGATWNTQNDYPVIQQAMLRVNDGWAKEEDTWYPQTSDTRPVYMKTADGWALAWYAGNINGASSPIGTNTTGSTGGGTGGGGTGGGTGGGVGGGTDPSATGHAGDIYNPWSGYSISGTWQDHMSYSAGGIDYPLGYGTRLAAPAAGTLHTSGGSGEFAAGWVGSAGRRSVLYLDTPMPRVNANLEQNEGSGPMVAIVLQHQSAFGNNGQHYGKGDYCGMSGASANGSDYGGQTHLHVHGLNASGQRVDFLNYI